MRKASLLDTTGTGLLGITALTLLAALSGCDGGETNSTAGAGGTGTAGAGGTGTAGTGGTGTAGTGGTATTSTPTPDPPKTTCEPPVMLADIESPTTVVGTGTPASCTESALDMALAKGGTITFNCGGQHTITVTSTKQITMDTVLDGGGDITLSGGGTTRILAIQTGNFEALTPTLTVQRLTLRDGHATGTPIALGTDIDGGGGAIYHHGGNVIAIDSVFLDNECADEGPDVGGGAIYGVGAGETTISGCTFAGNKGANGGAVGVLGGDLTIVNSTLQDNVATGFGANYIDQNGNQAGRGGNGGAIVMDGKGKTLTLCGVIVSKNTGGAFGGAVFRTSYASEPTNIDLSTFEDNQIPDHADKTEPSGAGGLYLQGSKVTITGTTISGNASRGFAGLWILGHGPSAPATANLTNVTIANNTAWEQPVFTDTGIGGGLIIGDGTTGTLLNCTIAGNAAQFASGIARVSPLVVKNTIISNVALNQYTPLNCTGSSYATPSGTGDRNLQWPNGPKDDMDCTPGIQRADPLLGALGENGGPTKTMLPQAGSPALGGGAECPPTDQRGEPRKAACTIGAVEVP
ncbi:MAG: right-handed parallel beta-helix repeat-containing protein [Polyangiaceae bacterium]